MSVPPSEETPSTGEPARRSTPVSESALQQRIEEDSEWACKAPEV
jgi:hypothetical protein